MANPRVLADTSLFIEYLRTKDKKATMLYRLETEVDVETSAVVAAELFYGARKPESEENARLLLRPYPVHPFTAQMAARQGPIIRHLRHINHQIDLRDLMIAVTAIDLGLPLTTLNLKHFENVPGLKLVGVNEN